MMASNIKKLNFGEAKKSFFNKIVSADNLLLAWLQLKSRPDMRVSTDTIMISYKINCQWFENASKEIIKGNYKYPNKQKLWVIKSGEVNE